jgi:hypothetical protein
MLEHRSDLTSRPGIPRADDFRAWLRISRPGDRVVYHQGFLVVDRGTSSPLRERERRRLDVLATAAGAAAAAGLVHLVQWRCAPGTFVYLAVKALPARGVCRSDLPQQIRASQAANGAPLNQPAERISYRDAEPRYSASPVGM